MTATLTDRPHAKVRLQRLPRHDVPKKIRYTIGLNLAARFLCWATRNNRAR